MRNGTPGNLYILSNPTQPGFLKIGKTTYHPRERAQALSRETGVAGEFHVEYGCVTNDVHRAETYIKDYLAPFRTGKKKEHFRDIGLAFARHVVNRAAERYGLPLTDLEQAYDIRVRGIYLVVDNGMSVKDAVRYLDDLCNRHSYLGAAQVWGEPHVYLMTDCYIQHALQFRFTAAYTKEFKATLMASPFIKGFHIMAELGPSHSIDIYHQNARSPNFEGELCEQIMRYQDWTGIHDASRYAFIPLPREPFLGERIDHDSSRWNGTVLSCQLNEVRFESNLCCLLNPADHATYTSSYNYPEESAYGTFLRSHFGKWDIWKNVHRKSSK